MSLIDTLTFTWLVCASILACAWLACGAMAVAGRVVKRIRAARRRCPCEEPTAKVTHFVDYSPCGCQIIVETQIEIGNTTFHMLPLAGAVRMAASYWDSPCLHTRN